MLATLASIELYTEKDAPPCLSHEYLLISVAADGLCFWSCLWLGVAASNIEVLGWHRRPRSEQGFTQGNDAELERSVVREWALQLPNMPSDCRDRIQKSHSAEHEDIASRLAYVKLRI